MSITDELRECARAFLGVWVDSASQTITFTTSDVPPTVDSIRMDSRLLAIADSIDAEHKKAIASVMNDALYYANDKDMAEHGWVRLPKDADGKPIHMGDLVTVPWKDKVYEVAGFSCSKQLCGGIRTIWIDVYSPEKQRNVPLCGADSCRHYHAPTVEDVLREMADRIYADEDEPRDRDAIVAEYAAKLQLRGDGE